MRISFEWRDPHSKYRWKTKEIDLSEVPRIGEQVCVEDFVDKVTDVSWRLEGDSPWIEITLGDA